MTTSSFLYPFLSDGSPKTPEGVDPTELINAARESWAVGVALDAETLAANDDRINAAAQLITAATANEGRVFVIGNGGSASDAQRLVRLLGDLVSARTLLDPVVMSALANDVGAPQIFARQIETFARTGDVVVAFTTSGTSANIVAACGAARRRVASTVAFAGYNGGVLREHSDVNVCLGVDSSSVHRIQEAQGAMTDELVRRIHQLSSVGELRR
jgi:D-sedoheptulose 7-phosphate isomerase